MAAVQLRFSLSLHSKPKTVHLLGSWNGYQSQYPLSKDSSKSGGWVGLFKFQPGTVQQGQRYWYYYIVDGYKPDFDKARPSVTEPTTGRQLNVLDIPPPAKSSSSSSHSSSAQYSSSSSKPTSSSSRSSRHHHSSSVAKGRSLSPSQIQSPLPSKPYATRQIAHEKFDPRDLDRLTDKYSRHAISGSATSSDSYDSYDSYDRSSPGSSDSEGGRSGYSSTVPSLTSRSSNASSPDSISSRGSTCMCERYAITRSGSRVKLDCGGQRCGYSDQSSECSSESDSEKRKHQRQATRRHGVVVRR